MWLSGSLGAGKFKLIGTRRFEPLPWNFCICFVFSVFYFIWKAKCFSFSGCFCLLSFFFFRNPYFFKATGKLLSLFFFYYYSYFFIKLLCFYLFFLQSRFWKWFSWKFAFPFILLLLLLLLFFKTRISMTIYACHD